jgi:tryptophanyl-tRNA synthetase
MSDMLPGFKEGQEKMSKSDPSSAIFMEDDEVVFYLLIIFIYLQSL